MNHCISEKLQKIENPPEGKTDKKSSPCSLCVLYHPAKNTDNIGHPWITQHRIYTESCYKQTSVFVPCVPSHRGLPGNRNRNINIITMKCSMVITDKVSKVWSIVSDTSEVNIKIKS